MKLNKDLLYNFMTQPLRSFSDSFLLLEKGNPFLFQLENQKFSVHISYVHDSGNNRPNEDENRIQISRSQINKQIQKKKMGYRTSYVGFYPGGEIFTAWDPQLVETSTTKTTTSEYARMTDADKALRHGVALYFQKPTNLGVQVRHPTLQASALGFYLQNMDFFHMLPTHMSEDAQLDELKNILSSHPQFWDQTSRFLEISQEVTNRPEKVTLNIKRTAYPRIAKFSRDVRNAYKNACSICGKQLNLVEAAHIIPHSHEDSKDTIDNGIALCVEHHRLYDDALIILDVDRRVEINDERKQYLEYVNQLNGFEELQAIIESPYRIPDEPQHQPNEKYLRLGKKIRMGLQI